MAPALPPPKRAKPAQGAAAAWHRTAIDALLPGAWTIRKRANPSGDEVCERYFDLAASTTFSTASRPRRRGLVPVKSRRSPHPLMRCSYSPWHRLPGKTADPRSRRSVVITPRRDSQRLALFLPQTGSLTAVPAELRASSVFTLGATDAWQFVTDRTWGIQTFAFGNPTEPTRDLGDVLLVTSGKITIQKASPIHPEWAPTDDVTAEWEKRHTDIDLYFLRRAARSLVPGDTIPSDKDPLGRLVCPILQGMMREPQLSAPCAGSAARGLPLSASPSAGSFLRHDRASRGRRLARTSPSQGARS